jgi:hypothetical protein
VRWISREAPVSFPTLSRHRHRADRLAWHALAARPHVRRERREFRVPLPARAAGDALAQLPHFLDCVLISCGLAGAFSDYFGSIA